jgi:nickel-dependent lactate racemase
MKDICIQAEGPKGISDAELQKALAGALPAGLRRVLLLPPDDTRFHSGGGRIANIAYHLLKDNCRVDVMPALGTHAPMDRAQCRRMFGDIPFERFIAHAWRTDVIKIGTIPGEFVREVSEGLYDAPIDVEVNRRLLEEYDLILSIGQVVPHEVAGMANHAKNIFVGCGGPRMIHATHILSAFYGVERVMGREDTPARRLFDYAAERFLKNLPIYYLLTVATAPEGETRIHGLFGGADRDSFLNAAALAREKNIRYVEAPLKKVVVYLDKAEFRTTWLGNKAIYRTRMAIQEGGELIVLAPGVERFGEDDECDRLIRKYGYCGRDAVIRLCRTQEDLKANLSAAAHLIHGSADGRFSITYCTKKLSREDVEGVGYRFMPYMDAVARYDPARLAPGYNHLSGGEEVFFIPNPALGLWAIRETLEEGAR